MIRRGSLSNVSRVNGASAGSAHSTPRLALSSSQECFATSDVDLAAVAEDAAPASPPLQPLPATHHNSVDDAPSDVKKKKKEKKEKKEKRGRPQNALFTLAGAASGGAAVSANVLDLRALDMSPLEVTSKRNLRTVSDTVPPTQILGFLFLGSVRDAQDPSFLAKHDIRYIINVSQEEYWSVDKRVQIFTFKVEDTATADIASLFLPTRSLINSVRDRYFRNEAAGKSSRPAVLVHCQKGRSRSVTIVLAYLIYMNGWSVAEAMKYVSKRRPCAEPNIGFMEELRKLQESLTSDDRTKRYSELCWFMRNLDAHTSEAQVRDMFEQSVGMVRDVVMLTAPGSGSSPAASGAPAATGKSSFGAAQKSVSPIQPESAGTGTSLVSFSMGEEEEEENDDGAGGAGGCAEAQESAHIRSPLSPSASNGRVALCFVFLTCREDILRGIKRGQLRAVLERLRPAAGKHIKYATGPKLRKLMTEHQSMSSSFAGDMAQFNHQLRRESDTAPESGDDDDGSDVDAASTTNSKKV